MVGIQQKIGVEISVDRVSTGCRRCRTFWIFCTL